MPKPAFKRPWLIARCNIDVLWIDYDNMGAVEFEEGAVPDSLKRLYSSEYRLYETKVNYLDKPVVISVIAPASLAFGLYEPLFQKLVDDEGKLDLHDPTNFLRSLIKHIGGHDPEWPLPDTWHDIQNDVLFTLFSKESLEAALKGIRAVHLFGIESETN